LVHGKESEIYCDGIKTGCAVTIVDKRLLLGCKPASEMQ
jgi:hypothetical protein